MTIQCFGSMDGQMLAVWDRWCVGLPESNTCYGKPGCNLSVLVRASDERLTANYRGVFEGANSLGMTCLYESMLKAKAE